MKSPLCEHHAHGRLTGETPHRVVAEAKKVATQRLIHRRWDEFQRYVDEAITSLTGVEPRSTSRQARAARKVEITDDLLREVAGIYRANVTDRPTEAVAEHFDKAHRTAARYIELAREAGFLGAATRGKAGEQ
ncbi:MAG: hypothetical protein ACRDQD_00645 [Nocardioidaceae bacterium]